MPKTLALIGSGNWGKNLARNFHALGALHTICDLKESVQFPGVQFTSDLQSVLQNPTITQIAIAAPAALHYSLAKQSLLAGKDTYVEKPLCLDATEAEELIRIAQSKNLILMVGHLLQYHPCIIRLQELIKAGELGKIQTITSNRLNLGTIRTEENVLWSFAPHDISVILSICGEPTDVHCTGESYLSPNVVDTALTNLCFPNKVQAHIYTSWIHPYKEQRLTVIGSQGMAVFDDLKPWNEKLQLIRNPVKWLQGNIPQANKSEPECIPVSQSEPLQDECAHFLACCAERKTPKTDGKEGLRVLKVLKQAQECLTPISPQNIHPTAVIDPGAEIGAGTKIWHFSHIMSGSKIGPSCNLGQNVVVSPGVILGRNVKVQNNVSIYTGVVCEDDVFLGPSMVFTNVINPRSAVNRRGEYQKTLIKRGATIGANSTIVCGIQLGEYSFVGAGAVVTKNVKPFALVVGNPAHQIGWMSRNGDRLGLPLTAPKGEILEAACPSTGEIYRLDGNMLTFVGKETPIPV
ncbi:MAG: Gfo/Idh/MocA family oxidoreductase [Parachlamydiales bacterium]|nr:Gfo/Idh/MocA family oxidoreductase [Parachlamydiales bacterium]